MMANNARRSWGRVLVGGLGLGLYPQYAAYGMLGELLVKPRTLYLGRVRNPNPQLAAASPEDKPSHGA